MFLKEVFYAYQGCIYLIKNSNTSLLNKTDPKLLNSSVSLSRHTYNISDNKYSMTHPELH